MENVGDIDRRLCLTPLSPVKDGGDLLNENVTLYKQRSIERLLNTFRQHILTHQQSGMHFTFNMLKYVQGR